MPNNEVITHFHDTTPTWKSLDVLFLRFLYAASVSLVGLINRPPTAICAT